MRQRIDDLRLALRALAASPAFTSPTVAILALASGLGISVLGLVHLDSLKPLRLGASIALDPVRSPGWGARWNTPLWSAGQVQGVQFGSLLVILSTVTVLGVAIAVLGAVIMVVTRSTTRAGELALQSAVGAGPARLRRQLLAEGLTLAGVGVVGALVLGSVGLAALRAAWPHATLGGGILGDPLMLGVSVGLPAMAVVVCSRLGLAIANRRGDLSGDLTAAADIGQGRRSRRLQDGLAVIEIAVSVTLLIGTGLLIRSTAGQLTERSRGSSEAELLVSLDLSEAEFTEESSRVEFYEALLRRLESNSATQAESLSTPGAWRGLGTIGFATAHCGRCYRSGIYLPLLPAYVRLNAVSPGFFEAAGVPLISGREFTWSDRADGERVALVNRTFAESHFERGDPLGRVVQLGGPGDPEYTVVGVVGDLPGFGIGPTPVSEPALYVSLLQDPPRSTDLVVGAAADPAAAMAAVTREIGAATGSEGRSDRTGVSFEARTVASFVARQTAPLRWFGGALAGVAVVTTVLAVAGVHAVMRYRVSQRLREIGLRRALGAPRRRIAAIVVGQSLLLAGLGGLFGVWGMPLLAGWLKLVLPGVRPFDPLVYAAALLALCGGGLLGGIAPAWRAARVDPAAVLRSE